jgi:hypothetical protein
MRQKKVRNNSLKDKDNESNYLSYEIYEKDILQFE